MPSHLLAEGGESLLGTVFVVAVRERLQVTHDPRTHSRVQSLIAPNSSGKRGEHTVASALVFVHVYAFSSQLGNELVLVGAVVGGRNEACLNSLSLVVKSLFQHGFRLPPPCNVLEQLFLHALTSGEGVHSYDYYCLQKEKPYKDPPKHVPKDWILLEQPKHLEVRNNYGNGEVNPAVNSVLERQCLHKYELNEERSILNGRDCEQLFPIGVGEDQNRCNEAHSRLLYDNVASAPPKADEEGIQLRITSKNRLKFVESHLLLVMLLLEIVELNIHRAPILCSLFICVSSRVLIVEFYYSSSERPPTFLNVQVCN